MNSSVTLKNKWLPWGGALLALGLLAGCATKPLKPKGYAFFPAEPDEPRIQFLTSFGNESDLHEKGSFSDFVLGSSKVFRPLWKPYGISARRGQLCVADTQANNVAFIDIAAGRIRYLRPSGPGEIKSSLSAVVDAEENCYVSDGERGQVLVFNKAGNFHGAIGKTGDMKTAGLALVGDKLYVCDLKNQRVQAFDRKSRAPIATYPANPAEDQGRLFGPTNVAVDKDGRVYVSDSRGFRVQVYNADGSHLRTIGGQGLAPGRFALPKGIGVDREGITYVVDAATAVVQMFDAEGRLLMFFGEPNTSGPGGLYLPAGLCVDYENVEYYKKYVAPGHQIEYLIFVVSQVGDQKVGVYGYLKKPTT